MAGLALPSLTLPFCSFLFFQDIVIGFMAALALLSLMLSFCSFLFFQDIVIGFMAGLALPFWFVVESLTTDYVAPTLPMSISGCNITTYDVTMMNTTVHPSSAQYLMTNTSTFNLHLQQEKSVIFNLLNTNMNITQLMLYHRVIFKFSSYLYCKLYIIMLTL